MATLLEILKAQGATEADLELMKPLLGNQKFAGAIEAEITAKGEAERKFAEANGKLSEFESQRNQFEVQANEAKAKVEAYDNWYNTTVPASMGKINQDLIREAQRAAAAEAKLAKAKEIYGFEIPEDTPTTGSGSQPASLVPPTPGGQQPVATQQPTFDSSKFVSTDDFRNASDVFGHAVASQNDLLMEHISLFGTNKPVNFESLRTKAVSEKKPLREIWERELHVNDRRQEIQAKEQSEVQAARAAELDAARKEGYIQGASQSVNPMTREAMPSRFGTTFTARDTTSGKPWDVGNSRSQDRLQKVVSTLAKAGAA